MSTLDPLPPATTGSFWAVWQWRLVASRLQRALASDYSSYDSWHVYVALAFLPLVLLSHLGLIVWNTPRMPFVAYALIHIVLFVPIWFDVQCGNLRGPVGRIDGDRLDGPERLIVLGVERRAAFVAPVLGHIGGELIAGEPMLEKHRGSEDRFPAGLADHRVAAYELAWAGADGVESDHDVAGLVGRYRGKQEALRGICYESFLDDGGVRRIDPKPMDGPTPCPGIDGVRRHPDLAIHLERRRVGGGKVVRAQRQSVWVGLWRKKKGVEVVPPKEIVIRIAAADIEVWRKDVAADVVALVRAIVVLNVALRRQDDLVLLAAVEIDGRHEELSRVGIGKVLKDGPAIDPRLAGQQVTLGQHDEGRACRVKVRIEVKHRKEQARAVVAHHRLVTVRDI